MKQHRPTLIVAAVLALVAQAHAQQAQPVATAPAAGTATERIEVTGSRIKRTDSETPSVVQIISREEIQRSGYTTVEEMLRANSAVDTGSISDGAASGFVSGLSTISLRGFGSQGTLVLINGRRVAPVAAVDINFGRGSLINVNTLPKGAIDRIEILKDGASALYGSDAMAGVVNYILRKDYQGLEVHAGYGASTEGVGPTTNAGITFGMGNLGSQGFNLYGGLEASKRDGVMHSQLRDKGDPAAYDAYLNAGGALGRFTTDSVASFYGNYYRLPTSLAGSTVIGGVTVANNNANGVNFLGSLPGCPAERLVGSGVPIRLPGMSPTSAAFPVGMCRFNLDNAAQAISAQDRVSASLRGTYRLSSNWTAYADVMASTTKTTETQVPYTMTTTLATSGNPLIVSWPRIDGSLLRQSTIILPVGHPDNPTNGTATPQTVQLIYRFEDLPRKDVSELRTSRFTAGIEGSLGAWDIDAALLYSRQDNTRTQTNRVRSSLLTSAIASGSYRFGGVNNAAAIASVASDAINEGESTVISADVRATRELFAMKGGNAAIALGLEQRREELASVPSDIYQSGDFIGLVANGTSGSRNSTSAFAELSLPVYKALELQAAVRGENYSDFGDATTGKLGFKWTVAPSTMAFRGTVATGFRAPSISQISNSFLLSFHSSQDRRVFDPIRCNASNPAAPVSLGNPAVVRDCNVLGFTSVPTGQNAGNLATVISGNPNLEPETSKSATFGLLLSPTTNVDLSFDAWFFKRKNEIRVQRGIDIMDAYTANTAALESLILRDPNPTSWLPGVPNSGPIIGLTRQYGNFNWTRTAGIDYDLNWRLPKNDLAKLTLKVDGTYTRMYDQKVLATSAVDFFVGTSSSEIPKTKARVQLLWDRGPWSGFVRYNHTDPLFRISGNFTATCRTSTSAQNTLLRANDGCRLSGQSDVDLGVTFTGVKNLTLSATVLNVTDEYTPSFLIPSSFQYNGTSQGLLGRRFTLNAGYKF